MKLLFLFVSLFLPVTSFGEAVFNKINGMGQVTLNKEGEIIDFTINQDNSCLISGKAFMIDDHRATYTAENIEDLCTIVFNFTSENDLIITSKSCCNLIDGGYQSRDHEEIIIHKLQAQDYGR